MRTELCKLLGIQYPILQGGMAWVSESGLAAAVSNAGGLGIIAGGNAPAEVIREEIRKTKELTDKPFGVNIMLLSPYAKELAQILIEEKVPVVTTGAGSPERYLPAWKEAGIKVIPVISSVALAKRMQRYGADAVIAEGCESGGHIGELTTMTLVPQVVDQLEIPVIAAGGIGDGRGLAAVMMLGAVGAQLGTRFLVAKECIIHTNYKEKVLKASDIDSTVTGRSHGHPIRAIKNAMTREYLKLEKEGKSFEELEHLTLGSLKKAVVDGDVTSGTIMAGQIAGLVKKEQSCQEIIEEIMLQANALIQTRELV